MDSDDREHVENDRTQGKLEEKVLAPPQAFFCCCNSLRQKKPDHKGNHVETVAISPPAIRRPAAENPTSNHPSLLLNGRSMPTNVKERGNHNKKKAAAKNDARYGDEKKKKKRGGKSASVCISLSNQESNVGEADVGISSLPLPPSLDSSRGPKKPRHSSTKDGRHNSVDHVNFQRRARRRHKNIISAKLSVVFMILSLAIGLPLHFTYINVDEAYGLALRAFINALAFDLVLVVVSPLMLLYSSNDLRRTIRAKFSKKDLL